MLVKLTHSLIRNTIIHLCNLKPVNKCQYWTPSPMLTFFSLNIWYFSHKILGPWYHLWSTYTPWLIVFLILEKSLCFLSHFTSRVCRYLFREKLRQEVNFTNPIWHERCQITFTNKSVTNSTRRFTDLDKLNLLMVAWFKAQTNFH